MKPNGWLLLLAAGLIACFGALRAAPLEINPGVVATAHLAVLERFRLDSIKSGLEENPARMAGYYAETIRLMPEYQKTVLGKTNVSSYYQAFSARFKVLEYQREKIEVLDLGSSVVELGRFSMKLVPKNSGQKQELVGKYQDIWEKRENGELALKTEAWNYDHPVPNADLFKFAEVPAVQIAFQGRVPITDHISFELAALGLLLEAAVSQHDARLWAQFYTDDAIMVHSYSPFDRGRKAIDAYLEDHVKHLPVFEKLDIRNDRIEVSGNYIIEYASHVANWRNGESSGVTTGKNIRIWRREQDGSLKIFRQIGMYD